MLRRMTRDRYLSDLELERFLAVVRDRRHVHQPRDYALFSLLAVTGIRPSEALALCAEDMHVARAPYWLHVLRLKKKRPEPVYDDLEIPGELAGVLKVYLDQQSPEPGVRLFRIHRRSLQRLFQQYARKANLPERFYCYCLRHTAATRIYRATRDIHLVQAVLGHDSPDTSCVYAHVTKGLLRDHVDAMPSAL